LGYKGPVLSEKIEDNAIVTCVFPNDNFLDPVLVIHNI